MTSGLSDKQFKIVSELLKACTANNISIILYGSFLVKHYSKADIPIRDIDVYVSESQFTKIIELGRSFGFEAHVSKEWHTLQLKKEDILIEFDSMEFWYDGPEDFVTFSFYESTIKALSLEGLKYIYKKAALASDQKDKNLEKLLLLDHI